MQKYIKLSDSEALAYINTLIPNFNPDNEKIAEIIWVGANFVYMTCKGKFYISGVDLVLTFNPPNINVSAGDGLVAGFDIINFNLTKPLAIVKVWNLISYSYYLWSPLTNEYVLLTDYGISSNDYVFSTKPISDGEFRIFALQNNTGTANDINGTKCIDLDATSNLTISKVDINGVSDGETNFLYLSNSYLTDDLDIPDCNLVVSNAEGQSKLILSYSDIDVSSDGILHLSRSYDTSEEHIFSPTDYQYYCSTGATTFISVYTFIERNRETNEKFLVNYNDGTSIPVVGDENNFLGRFIFGLGNNASLTHIISTYRLVDGASNYPLIFALKDNLKITGVTSNFGVEPTNTLPHELEQYKITKVQFVSQLDNQFILKFTGDVGTENFIINYNPAAEIPNVDYITINGVKIPKGQEVEVNIFKDFAITIGSVLAIKLKKKDGTTKTYNAVKFVKKDGTSKTYTKVRFDKA